MASNQVFKAVWIERGRRRTFKMQLPKFNVRSKSIHLLAFISNQLLHNTLTNNCIKIWRPLGATFCLIQCHFQSNQDNITCSWYQSRVLLSTELCWRLLVWHQPRWWLQSFYGHRAQKPGNCSSTVGSVTSSNSVQVVSLRVLVELLMRWGPWGHINLNTIIKIRGLCGKA